MTPRPKSVKRSTDLSDSDDDAATVDGSCFDDEEPSVAVSVRGVSAKVYYVLSGYK